MSDEGEPLHRRGVIRAICKKELNIRFFRQSGSPKYEEDIKEEINEAFQNLGPCEEIWNWTTMDYIEEIVVPPPIAIERDSIQWQETRKDILEIPFTGPLPGFKPNMDLGHEATDFD